MDETQVRFQGIIQALTQQRDQIAALHANLAAEHAILLAKVKELEEKKSEDA